MELAGVVRVGLARYLVKVWRPEDHPRDPATGRFIHKPGGTWRPRRPVTVGRLRKMGDDDIYNLFSQILKVDSPGARAALELVNAEIDRRESEPPDDSTPEERRIDDLVGRGWSYMDAYAEVHGGNAEQLRRDQANATVDVDRRAGETRRQAIQRSYREHTYLQLLAAEQATRGHLLTKEAQAANVDPISLFSGPAARARKWASEDLKRWWENNPRVTFTEFEARLRNPAARRDQTRGNGRDFGV